MNKLIASNEYSRRQDTGSTDGSHGASQRSPKSSASASSICSIVAIGHGHYELNSVPVAFPFLCLFSLRSLTERSLVTFSDDPLGQTVHLHPTRAKKKMSAPHLPFGASKLPTPTQQHQCVGEVHVSLAVFQHTHNQAVPTRERVFQGCHQDAH